MKIALIVQRFPYGGAESYVEQIAQRLHTKGSDVTVISSKNANQNDTNYEFPVVRLPSIFSIGEYSFWHGLNKVLGREKFDLVHVNSYGYFHTDRAVSLKKKYHYKVVMTSHGFHGTELHLLKKNKIIRKGSAFDLFRSFYDKQIGSKTICNSDHLIALSKKDLEFYRQAHADKSKISIIHPGIKNSFFLPPKEDSQKIRQTLNADPVLLSVGELSWIKAKHLAIKAMSLILKAKPKAKLFFIGKNRTELKSLSELSHKLGVEKSVSFLGFKTDDELKSYMQASDLLLHTSLAEGLSTILLESMACGLPFVTTPAGGNGYLAEESGAGLTVPFENENALASTVVQLIDDKKKVKDMSSKARLYAGELAWDKVFVKINQVYTNLTQGR